MSHKKTERESTKKKKCVCGREIKRKERGSVCVSLTFVFGQWRSGNSEKYTSVGEEILRERREKRERRGRER